MKIDRIDLLSNATLFASFGLTLLDVRNPYIIKAITGLDVDQIVPRFYGQGTISNKPFYDLTLEPREIAMRIGLNPNYNTNIVPADLRDDLYRAIALSRDGQMQIQFVDSASGVQGILNGFVTKFEAPLFSRDTEVQITVRCNDPMIKAPGVTTVAVAALAKPHVILEDPFSTAPHGFLTVITFDSVATYFDFIDEAGEWHFRVDHAFIVNDALYISSEFGNKDVYVDPSATAPVLLGDSVQLGSIWPIMFPGINKYNLVSDGTWHYTSLSYTATYWGV